MKHFLIFMSFLQFAPKIGFSQEQPKPQYTNYIFDPKANAKEDLNNAIKSANKENKNVLLVVGGDWDFWCRYYNDILCNDSMIINILNANYVYLRINFSPINKNEEVLNALECPKRDGYPIFMILDKNGKKLYNQNADEFKKEAKLRNKILASFLNKWSPKQLSDSLKLKK